MGWLTLHGPNSSKSVPSCYDIQSNETKGEFIKELVIMYNIHNSFSHGKRVMIIMVSLCLFRVLVYYA